MSAAEAMALAAEAEVGRVCVRARRRPSGELLFHGSPCSGSHTGILSAMTAACLLAGCTHGHSSRERVREAAISPVAGCRTQDDEQWDRRGDVPPSERHDGPIAPPDPLNLCDVVPTAPQCRPRPSRLAMRYGADEGRLPAHLRARCWHPEMDPLAPVEMGIFAVQRIPKDRPPLPPDWPDGPDVVVMGVAADGVDAESVRQAAVRMLEPLGRCYASFVAGGAKDAPQGRLLLSARLAADGSVLEARAEQPEQLPEALVACARDTLKGQRFAAPTEELPSVQIDLGFVVRVLPPQAGPGRGGTSG